LLNCGVSGYKVDMNVMTIDLEQALKMRANGALLVDVRTPAEFAEATIPGAINVPIFSDDERVEVGTLYKQAGKAQARTRGVELVAPKIPALLAAVREAHAGRSGPVIVFCWRGGMRSRALTAFLELAGVPARQLLGGHKAFRRLVLDDMAAGNWGRILVLRGMTGVGKTVMLTRLAAEGYPVIDLEGLANHRGSAFGGLGLPDQPGQKRFEALLREELLKFKDSEYILVEGESRHIGRLQVPPVLFAAMQKEPSIWLEASLDFRVRCILDDYPAIDQARLTFERPIRALKERLGNEKVAHLLDLLHNGTWDELVRELMVNYYDPLYQHTFPENRIEIEVEPIEQGVAGVKAAIEKILSQPAAETDVSLKDKSV
jgi:tRNA 2-selenouridine synthase